MCVPIAALAIASRAQKLESLGILAGGIAHDFNNLLTGVLGNASLARMDVPSSSPAAQPLSQIETTAHRAAELCQQMLAYAGKGKFVTTQLDLSTLVEEMAQLLEVSISKTAVLKLDLARNLPAVRADPTQIRQVTMNLITNASDAMGDGSGVIAITTGTMNCDRQYLNTTHLGEELKDGTYVFLEVRDTGCGMDQETQAKMFDPFFSTKFTGRGLGMAATLGIVRGHHGAIKIYSELGSGTTTKVLLPASEQPAATPKAHNALDPSWRGSGTVLIVDDEKVIRDLGARILGRQGFEVLKAESGAQALELFRAHTEEIAVVLLDLTMPGLSGEETFRELRRIRPDVRVILSSGYNEQDAIDRFVGEGLAGFLKKPYSNADLVRKFADVLQLS